jgi:hypothetical protein
MTFEFLITYQRTAGNGLLGILRAGLAEALEGHENEFSDEAIQAMIVPRHERVGDNFIDDNGNAFQHVILAFTVELPLETINARAVLEEFATALTDRGPITHAVRFEDPLLQEELAVWAKEIFLLEMKLRRVLTLVYLHAYQDGDPYDLLRDESAKPTAKDPPMAEHMKKVVENQFFYFTFSQYITLNQRPEIVHVRVLLEIIQNSASYDAFRAELNRLPVADEDDALLLAGLKDKMDSVERMRNCVAHNRRPSHAVIENYNNARPLLAQVLDEYLAQWENGGA